MTIQKKNWVNILKINRDIAIFVGKEILKEFSIEKFKSQRPYLQDFRHLYAYTYITENLQNALLLGK